MTRSNALHNNLDGPQYDPLTVEREAHLLDLWQDEDNRPSIRHELIERHLRLVLSIGKGYTHRLPMEDIMGVGALALTHAADRWNPEKGNFYQWARRWITTALTKAVDAARAIRVPEEVANGAAMAAKDIAALEIELGRSLTKDERDAVIGRRRTFDSLPTVAASIDVDPEDGYTYHETVPDAVEGPESTLEARERHAALYEALGDLDDLERDVIAARFGLGGERETLTALGKRYGLSAEAMRRVEIIALAKLRHPAAITRLDGLL